MVDRRIEAMNSDSSKKLSIVEYTESSFLVAVTYESERNRSVIVMTKRQMEEITKFILNEANSKIEAEDVLPMDESAW